MFLYGSYGVVEVLCTLVKPYHLCHVINLCWSTIRSVWISRSFDSWLCIIDGYLNWQLACCGSNCVKEVPITITESTLLFLLIVYTGILLWLLGSGEPYCIQCYISSSSLTWLNEVQVYKPYYVRVPMCWWLGHITVMGMETSLWFCDVWQELG